MIKFFLFVFVFFSLNLTANAGICEGMTKEQCDAMIELEKEKAANQPVNPLGGGQYDFCFRLYPNDTEKQRQCIQGERDSRHQEPETDCFPDLAGGMKDKVSREFEWQQQRIKGLKESAEARMENIKNCRQEMREAWIDLQAKKSEQTKERNLLPIKLREAELKYEREINRINRECRQKADEDFGKYAATIQERGVISPDQLHGFGNRVNSHRHHFFRSCYRGQDNVNAMKVADKQLALNLDKARAEMRSVDDMVQSFQEQTEKIQGDILADCEDQEDLNQYNEDLTKYLTAKAKTKNKMETVIGFTGSIMNCMGGLDSLLAPVDPTGGSIQ